VILKLIASRSTISFDVYETINPTVIDLSKTFPRDVMKNRFRVDYPDAKKP
jgi:hypothetical protein